MPPRTTHPKKNLLHGNDEFQPSSNLARPRESMTVPQPADRKTFLLNLRQSRLLTEEQVVDALQQLPANQNGVALARSFVEKKWLTRFQAERLLAGRNTGFLLGPYRILDRLGRGGMGRVFKAEHITLKRVVALKVLAPHLLDSERARKLFLREVRAAAQLVHPNVVAAYDASEEGGHYYLVLEYVDGANLDQLVRKQGPLSVGLACDYIKQTANGLQAAHLLGMVHRDIKPSNLLVQRRGLNEDSPGLIKINDFGLARLGRSEKTGCSATLGEASGTILIKQNTVMGTPDFLSPEQTRDLHGADIRSDLYSLGCTFYFLLTGRPPFPGGSSLKKLISHSCERPEPIRSFRDDVPVAVVEIVDRLMAKSPEDRYQTPRELAEALSAFAVGGPTPWQPAPSNPELVTVFTTSDGESSDSTSVLEGNSSDEWAEMVNTPSPASSPTPQRTKRAQATSLQRHGKMMVLGLVVGGIAVGTLLAAVLAMR
jgi:serine/threonine protein kinase